MRTLTATLLAAQKSLSHVPAVKVEAFNKIAGVVRLDWVRLYTGVEPDYFHAVTIPGDGSLVRVRLTPPSDSRKLYRQRVASPGPGSVFSQWTYTNEYNAVVVSCCSLGAEVSIFWIKSTRAIYRIKSNDYGANFGSPLLIDYTPTTAIYGLAAAYKPNGDVAIFFADASTLYVKKCLSGVWQALVAWDKTTGNLSGIAVLYDVDWNLIVSGRDSVGSYKLWSLIYGDGGLVAPGVWSVLKEIVSAPSDGNFLFHRVFLDKPDVYRLFFVESFTGVEAYSRPFWSYSIPGATFLNNLWREPVPFNLSSDYGLAMAHYGDYCWLSSPASVWRASLTTQSIDISMDVLSARVDIGESSGKLVVELRNDGWQYAPQLTTQLDIGCQVSFSPGYITTSGSEYSPGLFFFLEDYEHVSAAGRSVFLLHSVDSWQLLDSWLARYQFRFNKDSSDMSVLNILAFVLARVGLKTVVISQSAVIAGYYPDFTIQPGNRGKTVVFKLLSFVPDVLFIEGSTAFVINPLSTDISVYSYGVSHSLLEGRYRCGAMSPNRVQVEGYDDVAGAPVVVDNFSWDEIARIYDRSLYVEDRNIESVSQAQAMGEAYIRAAELRSLGGQVLVPVNCGQQLYDVIDITDIKAGLSAEKKRVLGLVLLYDSRRGQYEEQLSLGAV